MPFDPTLAAIRFGMGLSPDIAPPVSADDILARLNGPDLAAAFAPIEPYSKVFPHPTDFGAASRAVNAARGTDGEEAALEYRTKLRGDARAATTRWITADMIRAAHTHDGFRERLTRFWADHFTVRPPNAISRHLISPYAEEAIRPNLTGPFATMLEAVIRQPLMIRFLDQHNSMGPNSPAAQRRDRGMNENLAREMLELHTLGVDGNYTQTDVRQLSELLTGLTSNGEDGVFFRAHQAEPGAETVLGRTYGGGEEKMENVIAVLRDLAVHPDTARHLARKLVVHFIGPDPDDALVASMADAYIARNGELMALYEVMLAADPAWDPILRKVKQPFDYIASSLRALAVPIDVMQADTSQDVMRRLQRPMTIMGQLWNDPVGPDGWSEDEENWITPQGMAGRITWAMRTPEDYLFDLPDPREFVYHALGPTPPDAVIFAAGAAETISDGIGIVLASAAFQRR